MSRPDLQTCVITPKKVNARAAFAVVLGIEDVEIIPGTDYKYAGPSENEEIYTGEDGMI